MCRRRDTDPFFISFWGQIPEDQVRESRSKESGDHSRDLRGLISVGLLTACGLCLVVCMLVVKIIMAHGSFGPGIWSGLRACCKARVQNTFASLGRVWTVACSDVATNHHATPQRLASTSATP